MRARKKKAKWENEINLFFRNVFFLSRNELVFFGNQQQFDAPWTEQKKMFVFGDARPETNARAHLKQRKKHSGLRRGNLRTIQLNVYSTETQTFNIFFFWFIGLLLLLGHIISQLIPDQDTVLPLSRERDGHTHLREGQHPLLYHVVRSVVVAGIILVPMCIDL